MVGKWLWWEQALRRCGARTKPRTTRCQRNDERAPPSALTVLFLCAPPSLLFSPGSGGVAMVCAQRSAALCCAAPPPLPLPSPRGALRAFFARLGADHSGTKELIKVVQRMLSNSRLISCSWLLVALMAQRLVV